MALYLEELGVPTIVAATKWDDVKPSQRVKQLRSLTGEYARSIRTLQPVSSETGENLETLGRAVLALIKEASTGSLPEETVPHLDPQEEE
jgi:GTP-binding protein EngB required for normal cell division